jgi:hypothetical protein
MIKLRKSNNSKREFFENGFVFDLTEVRKSLARFFVDTKHPPFVDLMLRVFKW